MTLDDFQQTQFSELVASLVGFWQHRATSRNSDPLGPAGDLDALHGILDEPMPREPTPVGQLVDQLERVVVPNSTNSAHPLYLAYVTPPAVDVSVLADAVTAILNQNVSLAHLAPAGTALEQKAVRWLADLVGYGTGAGGLLVDGGSMANLYGLALARRRALGPSVSIKGHDVDPRKQRIYCSAEIHHSVHKAAIFLGIGTDNVRCIPTDSRGAVQVEAMERAIRQDLESSDRYLPTTIVGAAGTRIRGAFDDIHALADLASSYNLWLHVDGAFGAFLKLVADPPPKLEYLHLADSLTLDPHKLMFLSFDIGCFLVQNRKDLAATFAESGERLDQGAADTNYMDLGIQLSRSMKGLKLWIALKHIGVEAYGREITRLMMLARTLERMITEDGSFELLSPAASIIVCFRWVGRPDCTEDLRNKVNAAIPIALREKGLAYVNRVNIDGVDAIRACMINFRTTEEDLAKLMEALRSAADKPSISRGAQNPVAGDSQDW